jgi:hypothetical protein
MEARLFACLATNDLFKHLSDFVPDPDDPSTKTRQFYVYCRGPKTPARYRIMNASLIFFSKTFVQLKYVGMDLSDINLFVKAQYQPNSCAKNFRCLFAIFANQGIRYTLAKSFNDAGTFCLSLLLYVCLCLGIELSPAEYSIYFHSLFYLLLLYFAISRRSLCMVETKF